MSVLLFLIAFFVTIFAQTPVDINQYKQVILDMHNAERSLYGVSGLAWDSRLVVYSQQRANLCVMTHSDNTVRAQQYANNGGSGSVGENLVWNTRKDVPTLVNQWIDEKQMWRCPNGYSSGVGHYTQMIWQTTTKVGCALTLCPRGTLSSMEAWYMVCQYASAGNVGSQPSVPASGCGGGSTPKPVFSPPVSSPVPRSNPVSSPVPRPVSAPVFVPVTAPRSPSPSGGSGSCYSINANNPGVGYSWSSGSSTTRSSCISKCSSYPIAAVSNGNRCWCFSSMPSYSTLSSSTLPCKGDSSVSCGCSGAGSIQFLFGGPSGSNLAGASDTDTVKETADNNENSNSDSDIDGEEGETHNDEGLSGGAIAGIVVGSIVAVVIAVALIALALTGKGQVERF